jgi:hypothetical protein
MSGELFIQDVAKKRFELLLRGYMIPTTISIFVYPDGYAVIQDVDGYWKPLKREEKNEGAERRRDETTYLSCLPM